MTEPAKTAVLPTESLKNDEFLMSLYNFSAFAVNIILIVKTAIGMLAHGETVIDVVTIVLSTMFAVLMFVYGIYHGCIAAIKHCKSKGIL